MVLSGGGRGDVLWKFCCTLPGLDGDLESFQVVYDGDQQLLSDMSPEHILFGPPSPGPPTWSGPEASTSSEATGSAEKLRRSGHPGGATPAEAEMPPYQQALHDSFRHICTGPHGAVRATPPGDKSFRSKSSWTDPNITSLFKETDRRSFFYYSACVSATLASPVSLAEGMALRRGPPSFHVPLAETRRMKRRRE